MLQFDDTTTRRYNELKFLERFGNCSLKVLQHLSFRPQRTKLLSSPSTTTLRHGWLRTIVIIFALVLGCLAAWILVAEFSRPFYPGLSATTQPDAVANRNSAASAASLGIIRGDLWAEYALSYLDVLQRDANAHDLNVGEARKAAERAVALAPHDARVWLFLAGIDSRFDWLNSGTAAALRMSYYTGANEAELMPLRLLLAVNSQALSNKDFRELVRHDIRTIVSRKPELNPSILAAYREALPSGRQFIEETLDQIDPGLLAKLRLKG